MSWPIIKDIAASVNSGQQSAVSLVNKSYKLIDEAKEYDAIISLTKERALKRAQEIDELVKTGKSAGKLAGVPFIAKDNFLVFGSETTAASNMLKNFKAPYQATAINKLEAEGAICVAKSNLDAYAHGSSTENSDYMVTKNPHNNNKVPGGSSGGSAASTALGLTPFSLGTDTGGSIRMPASFCGVVGYKPTYGLVSRSGVVAMASSTDVIGPITTSVDDAALVLNVISGKDELDSTTIENNSDFTKLDKAPARPKVGLIKEYLDQGLDKEVRDNLSQVVAKLKDSGATVEEISLPSIPLALAVYYILCPAEVASNLSRYDGLRYGYNDPKTTDLESSYKLSRSNGFGKEAKRRIMIGTYVLSSGYYDAYYKQAQLVRTKLINEFNDAFKRYDFLIGPTTATTAFDIGSKAGDPMAMYLTDIMTVAANLVGLPAISLPSGLSKDKLPLSLQIMAPQLADRQLLSYSKEVEALLK